MIFLTSAEERSLEKLMTSIPNFKRGGYGIKIGNKFKYKAEDCKCSLCSFFKQKECTAEYCPCIYERISTGTASLPELLKEALKEIKNPEFRNRLNLYIKESEKKTMQFRNKNHRKIFSEAVKKIDTNNYALVTAVYLFSADSKLWNQTKQYVKRNKINFEKIRLRCLSEKAYTLFCTAKDLYLGTKHITISDLADSELIFPKTFGLICNSMAIRRFGLEAIRFDKK